MRWALPVFFSLFILREVGEELYFFTSFAHSIWNDQVE